ncbi:alkaline phosphatase [Modestobacter sp. VKM Ac-2984]|uniref:alkaline phosphatase n=1 Tax=Modestobacter sp. VKM Ac-2984 TaxID=3004138 RepID=UPI0022AAB6AA|nr:alkaline phosphatase [Modestobacter sp. VKM Ac-2984]MCZ2816298.1 alkaline phosphatase [Modestobacter sp. VKM Ac-2984]
MQQTDPSGARRWPLAIAVGALSATVAFTASGVSTAAAGDDDRGQGPRDQDEARNAILFIGDGMGAAARNAGALATVGLEGSLVMDSLPYAGLVKTDSADPEGFVTDSAASATSYATGVKTYNGAIGLDAAGNEVETLIEQAEAAGLSTGLVTTGEITDASTAAFGAHVEDRDMQTEIARQYIEETGVDVLLGGGEDFWYPAGNEGAIEGGEGLSDQGNLVERAEELGYQYVSDAEGLATAESDQLLGLFANRTMFVSEPEPVGTNDRIVSLEEMTQKAIDVLSQNEKGFLLIVEEEAVDEQGHANNAEKTIEAVALMDQAVAVAEEFAEQDGDTLLVTTADHETGGMAVEDVGTEDESGIPPSTEDGPFDVADSEFQFVVDWTTSGHTNVDVPLTAMGPGAERLSGYYENTFVHQVIQESLFSGEVDGGAHPSPVVSRDQVMRWLDRVDFPVAGSDLVQAVRDRGAPEAVVAELERRLGDTTFAEIGDVTRALGR